MLQARDEDASVMALVDPLCGFPPYFPQLVEVDRRGPAVLDPAHAADGHLPGTTRAELGAFADALPTSPTAVVCGHGERAPGRAGPPEQTGHRGPAALESGPEDWADVTDRSLEDGA